MSLIWIIDDEPAICSSISRALQRLGHETRVFSAAEPALEIVQIKESTKRSGQVVPEIILLDVRLPGTDGLTASHEFQKFLPSVPIILMTAFGDLSTAVRAIEGRVFEYLTKPFDLSALLTAVKHAIESRQVPSGFSIDPNLNTRRYENPLLGTSVPMQTIFKRIALAAANDCPVLICGESGTGKEIVARAIHAYSANRDQPYLAVAPVSLNPSLIESELFGHERGAFTGADYAKVGVFELAGSGTILLDEIGDLPLGQQVKLLRVLEQREFVPVGGNKPRPLKARVLAATHRNLRTMVGDGTFREDLYFRLAVFTIDLPPLRERTEDILPLTKHFLVHHGYAADCNSLDQSTVDLLKRHPWSGNVRELRNAVEHAAILARGQRIYPEHLPALRTLISSDRGGNQIESDIPTQLDRLIRMWLRDQNKTETALDENQTKSSSNSSPTEDFGTIYDSFLGVVEPSLIRALLETAQGNRAAVANALGLHRSTLRQKMRRHKIDET